jgi:hypothetical protein
MKFEKISNSKEVKDVGGLHFASYGYYSWMASGHWLVVKPQM